MRRVSFWPRKEALALSPEPGALLISVFDRRSGQPSAYPPGWLEVLPLRFHDNDETVGGVEHFNEAQALAVFSMLERNPDWNEVVVHCDHGQSRSAAIALYLAKRYSVPCFEKDQLVVSPYRFANKLVLRVLQASDPSGATR